MFRREAQTVHKITHSHELGFQSVTGNIPLTIQSCVIRKSGTALVMASPRSAPQASRFMTSVSHTLVQEAQPKGWRKNSVTSGIVP